jgi:1,4-alpha-glucan branching enzyme
MMPHAYHYDLTRFTDFDIYLFREGTHTGLHEKFGSHTMEREGRPGVYFAVWAPNAAYVSIRADFNDYNDESHPMRLRDDDSGIWEIFIEGVAQGTTYKYHIRSQFHGIVHDKSDPYGFCWERPPRSATRVWSVGGYDWQDGAWMRDRGAHNSHEAPVSVYEVHLGSWRRKMEEENRYLTYGELAEEMVPYIKEMGFTHVELMPITEYPYFGSWGYQVTGFFAPTARYGEPADLMAFVDAMHDAGIGVIMDWVPSHFAVDMHGLANFDGTALYEHLDPRKGFHPEWGSHIFNYGRGEVRSFLISSAHFWMQQYHFDGIRVDAVASMLYLNYAREEGEWEPNENGGNDNIEAVAFLKALNESVYGAFPDILMFAEESTAWPMVTGPVDGGGLGFGFKWNMGWMHDTLKYFSYDPIYRQHHHHQLTFSMWYGFDENFILPLSHDEVVHMKGSLINKMPGTTDQKFANLRALYAYMMAHPGKKLLFMGAELAQFAEWDYRRSLDWHLLDFPLHEGIRQLLASLNACYRSEPALYRLDTERDGFEWIDDRDSAHNCLIFLRKSGNPEDDIIIVCNFSDQTREGFSVALPRGGVWKEIFNSQDARYDGWAIGNPEPIEALPEPLYDRPYSMKVTLPPLGVLYFKRFSEES